MHNEQLPKCRTTLKHPIWVKLGTLLLTTENKPKEKFLAIARTQKKNSLARTRAQKRTKTKQKQTDRVASRKALSL